MKRILFLLGVSLLLTSLYAQITQHERPVEWSHLVKGGRFIDRFLDVSDRNNQQKLFGGLTVYLIAILTMV